MVRESSDQSIRCRAMELPLHKLNAAWRRLGESMTALSVAGIVLRILELSLLVQRYVVQMSMTEALMLVSTRLTEASWSSITTSETIGKVSTTGPFCTSLLWHCPGRDVLHKTA